MSQAAGKWWGRKTNIREHPVMGFVKGSITYGMGRAARRKLLRDAERRD